MPNWCSVKIAFVSKNVDNLSKLKKAIYESLNDESLRNTSDFGSSWLGNLLIHHNINYNLVEGCRGWIDYFDEEIYRNQNYPFWYLNLEYQVAWSVCTDIWDELLSELGLEGGVQYVFIAEEEGNEYYENTDDDYGIFKDKYVVDYHLSENSDYEKEYFENEYELVEFIHKIIPNTNVLSTYDELCEYTRKEFYNESEDLFCNLHKFRDFADKNQEC